MSVRVIFRGGHRDGQEITINEPAPEFLMVPAPRPPVFVIEAFGAKGPVDVREAPEHLVYHRGGVPDLEGPPEDQLWEYYDDRETARVARRLPTSRNWRKVKPDRFQGEFRPPLAAAGDAGVCVAATLPDGRIFSMRQVIDKLDNLNSEAEELIWREFEFELEEQLLPSCVVPDCDKKGRVKLIAAMYGRLAGRLWSSGDEIRLCPDHHYDVLRVAPGGCEDLPAWLAADACRPLMNFGDVILSMVSEDGAIKYGGLYT